MVYKPQFFMVSIFLAFSWFCNLILSWFGENPSFAWFIINHGKSWFENCKPHAIMVY
jgi:hypothetical protein